MTGGLLLPVFTVLSAVWFAGMGMLLLSVWWAYEHVQFGRWPHGPWFDATDVPRWVAVIAILAVYFLFAMPLGAARKVALYYANGGRPHGWADAWSGLLWIALVAVLVVAAWHALGYMPGRVISL